MLSFSPCWILTLKLALIYADQEHKGSKSRLLLNVLQNNNFYSSATKSVSQEDSSDWFLPTISRYNSKLITLPPRPGGQYQNSRWGPYFEEGGEPINMTARVGTTVRLNCKISLLHGKTVTWVHRKGDIINLLTVARQPYSTDQRITLSFRYPNNWRLEITSVTHRDDGLYECQVATHPPTIKRVYLKITAPEVVILDEKGHRITERYYKAGSVVELYCHAVQVQFPGDNLLWWKNDDLITQGIMTNISTSTSTIISTLTILSVQKLHYGNYTCSAGHSASASVSVHILNGELPAAVHDGSSGTSFFMAAWLLILCCILGTHCTFFR